VAAIEPEKLNKNHFEQAFAYFDIDHSGTITYDEIAAFLEDQENSQDEIRKIFKDVDENMDGLISKEEFLHILTSKTRERAEEKQKKSRIRKGKNLAASKAGSAEGKRIK
jgi:Ca2+-binding EF-hand superfamily protein